MRRLPVSLVCLCLIALPATARAFQVQLRGQPAPVTLRGTVYDSLLRAPVAGARVWIVGGSQSTIADSSGHFRLDSVLPGRHVVAFEHPDLDSAGLSSNARAIDVAADRTTETPLATHSRRTIFRALCAADTTAVTDSGVVFGSVMDARSGTPLSDALVALSWVVARTGAAGLDVRRDGLTVSTDSVGNYYACGVPADFVLTVVGRAGRFTTGTTELLLGDRGIRRRDLAVSRDSASLPDSATGVRRGRATIIGTVVTDRGAPLAGAAVSVDEVLVEVTTNDAGVFVLSDLPAGSQTVMARLIGHSAVRVPVLLRDDDTVRVRLAVRGVTTLDTIRVTGRLSGPAQFMLEELEYRMRNGWGRVLTGEQVKNLPLMRTVFQMFPGVTASTQGRSAFDFKLVSRRGPVTIFVDGVKVDEEQVQSYRPSQIVAVEYFEYDNAPVRYTQSGGGPVMLVWTKLLR
jgi:hypothetical protein